MAGFDLLRQSWLNKAPQTPRGKEYTPPFLHKQRRLRLALKTRQLINEMAKWKIVSSCSSCFFRLRVKSKWPTPERRCPRGGVGGAGRGMEFTNMATIIGARVRARTGDSVPRGRRRRRRPRWEQNRIYRADPGQTAVNSSLPSSIRRSAPLPPLSFPLEG